VAQCVLGAIGVTLKTSMRLFVFLGLAAISVFGATDSSTESLIGKIPLRFERDSGSSWTARSLGFAVSVGGDSAVVHLGKEAFRVQFAGADSDASFAGEKKSDVPNNYFTKGDAHTADAYLQVRRENVYPGIDLVYYGAGQSLEYDFQLAPGADASPIRIRYDGAQSTHVGEDGSLVLTLRHGTITQKAPVTYQQKESGEITSVASRYVAEGDGTYSLKLASYDETRPLVIDPQILFAGYLQGTGADGPLSVNLDKNNVIYIAGFTFSYDFPLVCCAPTDFNLSTNQIAFVSKIDRSRPDYLIYSGFFGGSFGEFLHAATVDADGVFYLTGNVDDKFFPTTSNAYTSDNGNTRKMFLSVIDTKILGKDGLIYSTFFGGNLTNALADGEQPTGIALGPSKGQVFITGFTSASDYPVKNALQPLLRGQYDGFVAQFDITQSGANSLLGSTYLGGSVYDIPRSIAVDSAGKAYVAGYTYSSDFPVLGSANQLSYRGGGDAFLAKVDMAGGNFEYGTFLGGSGLDQAWKVLIDPSGRIALAGNTLSNDFPVTPTAMQRTPAGDGDVFLAILDLQKIPGQAIAYATLYGGNGSDVVYDMRIGSNGNYYLGGYTLSRNLRVVDAIAPVSAGAGVDGLVAIINPAVAGGSALVYSSYVTGPGHQTVQGIEVDSTGNVYVVGQAFDDVFLPGQAVLLPDTSTNVFVLVFRPSTQSVIRRPSTVLTQHPRTRQ
jgi:hypothetical protein